MFNSLMEPGSAHHMIHSQCVCVCVRWCVTVTLGEIERAVQTEGPLLSGGLVTFFLLGVRRWGGGSEGHAKVSSATVLAVFVSWLMMFAVGLMKLCVWHPPPSTPHQLPDLSMAFFEAASLRAVFLDRLHSSLVSRNMKKTKC